jgi:ATP-dependent DNA helicase DinG
VTRARTNAERAQVVVVNHHLFFADLAMRDTGAAILPPYDAVIFDEAHQIEDVATLFFGVQVGSARIDRLVRDARRTFSIADGSVLSNDAGSRLAEYVGTTGASLFETLPRGPEGSRITLDRETLRGPLESRIVALDDALHALSSHLRVRASDDEVFAQLARRAESVRDDVLRIGEGGSGSRTTWCQRTPRGGAIGASPVDVSTLLRENLFYRTRSVVLTSATLSTGNDFSYVKSRLGIDFPAVERVLPSPFSFPKQAALYLAGHMPDPRDPRFIDAATRETLALIDITRGGAFVLCTSFRMMHALAQACRPELDLPVLVQGESPKQILLDRFRRAGNAVLFATSSFWEGVDVPGDALRLVILDKLPFDVPSDPLVAARCERLRDEGEAPFARYLLPSAAIALKQGFGRLVRTEEDRGIVAILDSRIVHKGYGKTLLASLPDASRCYSLDEVRAFHALARVAEPPA